MNGMCIVTAARGWIGTRFVHQGRVKKTNEHRGGVDCLGLLVGIANELELTLANGVKLTSRDKINYSHYPDTEHFKQELMRILDLVDKEQMRIADILLLRVDGRAQHLAVVSNYRDSFGMIHAYAPARAVVEHALDSWWFERIDSVLRIRAAD